MGRRTPPTREPFHSSTRHPRWYPERAAQTGQPHTVPSAQHRGARQVPAPLLLPLPWPRLRPQAWLLLPPSSALRPNPASSSASPRGGQSLLGAGSAWMEPVRRDIAGCDPRAQRGGHTRRPGATSQDRGLRASGRTRVPVPRPRGAAAAGAAPLLAPPSQKRQERAHASGSTTGLSWEAGVAPSSTPPRPAPGSVLLSDF